MTIAALIIFGIIVATVGMAVYRLNDVRSLSPAIWLLLFAVAAVPSYVAWKVFNPDPAATATRVARIHEKATIQVPPGYDLLVTASLADLTLVPKEKSSETGKLNYRLSLHGDGWNQEATGEVRRKTGNPAADRPTEGGSSVKDTRTRGAATGEDTQTRFRMNGNGTVNLEVALWQGAAADGLVLEVIPQVAPRPLLWGIVGIAVVLGLIAEVRFRAIQLAGDLGFLSVLAVFLTEQVTPESSFQEAGYAAFGAALFGWLAVGGLGWLLLKWQARADEKAAQD